MKANLLLYVLLFNYSHIFCDLNTVRLAESLIKGFSLNDVILEEENCGSLNFTARTGQYGYLSEEHYLTTKDGYILKLFRIKSSKRCEDEIKTIPVLLLHGVLLNGMAWIQVGPDSSLAYGLSDLCYDVWIGNFRGTRFSRQHVSLEPSNPKFWDFCLDEFAKYDTTAFIDKILDVTGSDKVNIVGYSEGGAAYLALASTNKEYHDKIGVGITLEPSAYMYTENIILKMLANDYKDIYKMLQKMNKLVNLDNQKLPDNVLALKCHNQILSGTLCRFVFEIVKSGISEGSVNCVFKNFPEPMTFKTIERYSQHFTKNVFQMINLGRIENIKKYGTVTPPKYDVSKINHPVAIVFANREFIVTHDNLAKIRYQLGNLLMYREIDDPDWNHLSFIYANNINTQLVPIVNEALEPYSN